MPKQSRWLAAAIGLLDGATVGGGGADCGLDDGSQPGDWRLPNMREMHSLISYEFTSPAIPDTSGLGQWSEGDPVVGLRKVRTAFKAKGKKKKKAEATEEKAS